MDERKPFLQLSERQQRRRLAAVAHVDNAASLSEVEITNYDVNVENCVVESVEDKFTVAEESENESIGEISTSSSQENMNEIEDIDINMDIDEEDVTDIDNEENLAAKLCN